MGRKKMIRSAEPPARTARAVPRAGGTVEVKIPVVLYENGTWGAVASSTEELDEPELKLSADEFLEGKSAGSLIGLERQFYFITAQLKLPTPLRLGLASQNHDPSPPTQSLNGQADNEDVPTQPRHRSATRPRERPAIDDDEAPRPVRQRKTEKWSDRRVTPPNRVIAYLEVNDSAMPIELARECDLTEAQVRFAAADPRIRQSPTGSLSLRNGD